MNFVDRVRHLRAGSSVVRCHTCPTVGATYTVGHHSLDMAVLLTALYPDYSPQLMEAVILHDLHERHTGDCPRFAKTDDFRAKEAEAARALGTNRELDPRDQGRLEILDALELILWCRDQRALGSRMVTHIEERVSVWLAARKDLPIGAMMLMDRYDGGPMLPLGA